MVLMNMIMRGEHAAQAIQEPFSDAVCSLFVGRITVSIAEVYDKIELFLRMILNIILYIILKLRIH